MNKEFVITEDKAVISNEDAVLNYGLQYCQINIQLTEQILTLKRDDEDLITDKIDEHEPNTYIATYNNPTKTGYIFKNFNVYHKIPNNYNIKEKILSREACKKRPSVFTF